MDTLTSIYDWFTNPNGGFNETWGQLFGFTNNNAPEDAGADPGNAAEPGMPWYDQIAIIVVVGGIIYLIAKKELKL